MIDQNALVLAKTINKKLKTDAVVVASSIDHDLTPRVPTGSVSLDYALGGGWPGNQWIELVGEASSGKALDINTPIPTPYGWTTMEKLQPGSLVFDERGNPCHVTYATDIQHNRVCYEVFFSDGSSLVADADHQWTVIEKMNGGRLKQHTITTQVMVDNGPTTSHHKVPRYRYRIPTCEPLQYLMDKELPVDPYLLGLWLGDGHTGDGAITTADSEVVHHIQSLGYEVSPRKGNGASKSVTYGVLGLRKLLRQAGVLGDKHIPDDYLHASQQERIDLLQGLMDSDGYVSAKGSCEYTTVSKKLADHVVELVRGLGIACRVTRGDATLNGRFISHKYRIFFRTDLPVFRLSRKAQAARGIEDTKRTYLMRSVVRIERVESRPVKCIQVDSPNHLYLAGEACIPTHNTFLALKTIAANQVLNPDHTTVWVAAEQWVPGYAQMCGVDLGQVLVIETNVMEEAYQAVIQFAESQTVDAIVIDSLPALVPSLEDEKEAGESTVGKGALLTNQFFRKVGKAMKRSLIEEERPVLGVMINQYRQQIGITHGDPRTTPGGRGKDFAYFVRCEVRRGDWLVHGKGDSATRVGQTVKVRVIKNKTAPPQQVANIDFYFDDCPPLFTAGETDFAKEIVALGILNDILTRSGAWYYYGDRKWQGADSVLDSVREEPDLAEQMTKEVMEVVTRAAK